MRLERSSNVIFLLVEQSSCGTPVSRKPFIKMVKSARYLVYLIILLPLMVAMNCQSTGEGEDAYLCKKPDDFENPPRLVECIKIETVDIETTSRLAKRTGHEDDDLKMRIYVPFRVFQKMYSDILKEREREDNALFRPRT